MKKKLPAWAVYLLGIAACFLVVSVTASPSRQSPFLQSLMVAAILIQFVLVIALIVHLFQVLIRWTTKGHHDPDLKVFSGIESGAVIDGRPDGLPRSQKLYLYNNDETARLSKDAAPISWFMAFLMLFIVFPFGLFLLIVKTMREKGRSYRNGSVLLVVGLVLGLMDLSLILLLMKSEGSLTGIPGTLLVLLFYPLLINGSLFFYGLWLRHQGKTYDAYRTLITGEGMTNLDQLARRQKTDYAHAAAVVERLIDAGLLGDAYLYHQDREVVVPGISKKIARYCKQCGGTTVLYSTDRQVCDYCGGVL